MGSMVIAKNLITRRQREILTAMAESEAREDFEDAEIACDRGVCFLGDTRVAKRTVFALLRLCLVRDETEGTGHLERYTINEHGRRQQPPPEILKSMTKMLNKAAARV